MKIKDCAAGDIVVVQEPMLVGTLFNSGYLPNKGSVLRHIAAVLEGRAQQLKDETGRGWYMGKDSLVDPASDAAKEKFTAAWIKAAAINRGQWVQTGTDPEVFGVTKSGSVVPAFEALPSKDKALDVPFVSRGGSPNYKLSAFWDGFQAEFSVPPVTCHEVMTDQIRDGLKVIYDHMRKAKKTATITPSCVVDIPYEVMDAAPPECIALGCAPSLNAYEAKAHLDGMDAKSLPFRFAGCHIHFGFSAHTNKKYDYPAIVKLLDAIAGVASVSLLRGIEDPRRRMFYGLAGEYRLPKHGLEYRTLSSAILAHPAIMNLMFDLARCVTKMHDEGTAAIWQSDEQETQEVINNLDVVGAEKILARNKDALTRICKGLYGSSKVSENANKLIVQGAIELMPVNDMATVWGLKDDGAHWTQQVGQKNYRMNTLQLT